MENENKEKTHISYLEFSVRTENILREYDIKYVEQLTNISSRKLCEFRSLGKKSLEEIREKLANHGLCLSDEVVDEDVKKTILHDLPKVLMGIKSQVEDAIRELRFFSFKLEDIAKKSTYQRKIHVKE